MVNYILLLCPLFYLAWALPIEKNITQTNNTIINELSNLAQSCENSFVAELIRSKLEYCNIAPGYDQKNSDCIMFYEINSQLCTTFDKSEVDLKTNFTKKINLTYEVLTLCDDAKRWKSITPKYKDFLNKLFTTKAACLKVCTVFDELLSEDSNFFCKYFKWGSDLITMYVKQMSQTSSSNEPQVQEAIDEAKSDISALPNNAATSQTLNNESQQIHKDLVDISTKHEINLKTDGTKQDTTKKSSSTPIVSTPKQEDEVTIKNEAIPKSKLLSPNIAIKAVEDESIKINIDKEVKDNEKEVDFKPVADNPKVNLDQDLDDTNNDFGNDLDSDDDPDVDNINDGNDPEPKIEKPLKENSNINKLPHTSFMDIAQREVYPNAIQDSFSEEDDHFFPFFLTTIVFVVLLYILYHNKSKVTKLILGLIVEGRQSNRRRNSRGHAYRRLDTLEQAMSTNTTAPPSKIIY